MHSPDIDLTLCGGQDLAMKVLYNVMDELEDLHLPYTFDLSIFQDIIDPDVIEHIRRVGVTFYEKEDPAVIRATKGEGIPS